ncbi:hypothetical protein O6R05_02580 [Peptoniphilus equinus]|uniref:Uncharacterized protein n=1 Tax=Peptoniphilus equinus TaxID=3016343 RepID=A0ABY7QUJ4_9FIRM|nr:hypothetical protein [Peptoniphilus equinus]WBW50447.1 hypothetical protein O6R05_02580 [Peptoniphilus equinus]
MSAFLGYIHHLMWDRIQFTEHLVQWLLQDGTPLDFDQVGVIEKGNVSELIDPDNIHTWLSDRVHLAERRLEKAAAYVAASSSREDLIARAYDFGKQEDFHGTKIEAYQQITSKFLDGMPCDGACVFTGSDDEVDFVVKRDVHEAFWNDVSMYWDVRNAYIQGLIEPAGYVLIQQDNHYSIGDQHEIN